MRKFGFFVLFFVCGLLYAQESLKSIEEEYYDFLALQGLTERPYLNYRTLSDSRWSISGDLDHPWQGQNLGTKRPLFGNILMRVYGPELFMSVNTAAPYGQNDGALWQGKGVNLSLTDGVRFEGYGVEVTFKPQLSFSQNAAFDIISPNSAYTGYTDKAAKYGYYGVPSIDAPQRFGDKPFFTYDWGDSEIRYTWKTLTIGFGTQAVWLGPAQINPIIHSNNAASYPKLDIGLRRQPMTLPWLNWYIGDIETRAWWGRLSESDYFDNNSSNDHNLITGFSLAYSFPSFLRGLTIGMNRIMLTKWQTNNYDAIFTLMIPFMNTSAGSDEGDQRASVIFDYVFPQVGLDIFLEWGRNDFSPGNPFVYPFHTEGYTFGIKKTLRFSSKLQGEILLELSKIEATPDYMLPGIWNTTFYAHHRITQGYTHKGQWIAAGIGTGGNSQFLGFKLIHKKGYEQLFFQRRNPDLDYFWFTGHNIFPDLPQNTSLDVGISGTHFVIPNLSLFSMLVFRYEENIPMYNQQNRFNIYLALSAKYQF
jgi:hypothetical protein